jgi:hypothetical protein
MAYSGSFGKIKRMMRDSALMQTNSLWRERWLVFSETFSLGTKLAAAQLKWGYQWAY